jgi:hypothetical protein
MKIVVLNGIFYKKMKKHEAGFIPEFKKSFFLQDIILHGLGSD